MSRIFYDTEFHSPGHFARSELISIGMVRDDSDDALHLVSNEFDHDAAMAHDFLRDNVMAQLPPRDQWVSLDAMRDQVVQFLQPHDEAQLWAYFIAFDHYMLSNLFGTMLELPHPALMFTRDLKQEVERIEHTARERGEIGPTDRLTLPEQDGGEHDALADARHLQVRWDYVSEWALARAIDPPQ